MWRLMEEKKRLWSSICALLPLRFCISWKQSASRFFALCALPELFIALIAPEQSFVCVSDLPDCLRNCCACVNFFHLCVRDFLIIHSFLVILFKKREWCLFNSAITRVGFLTSGVNLHASKASPERWNSDLRVLLHLSNADLRTAGPL